MDKKEYGWDRKFEKHFINANKDLLDGRRGTFQITKHSQSGNYYWVFKFSSGKPRTKHICPVLPPNIEKEDSFSNCCNVLAEKLNPTFISQNKRNQPIHKLIRDFIDHTEDRKDINQITIDSKIKSIRQFSEYSKQNGLKINIIPDGKLREEIRNYVLHLTKRGLKGKNRHGVLSKGTIKLYLQNVRYFLDWVCSRKDEGGLELFVSHDFTHKYQTHLLNTLIKTPNRNHLEKKFSTSSYEKVYKSCLKKIRRIWIDYCSTGKLKAIEDRNGKVNQPQTVGTDIVYFISVLQLRCGFRISEILLSFRNPSVYEDIGKSNEVSSYFFKQELDDEEQWFLKIVNSKQKSRTVPVVDTIFSKSPPPNGIPYTYVPENNGEQDYYLTHIVDVIFELFPSSYYTFPSPNLHTKNNRPYSLTYYQSLFKQKCVIENEWSRHGINCTHNLRSFFINYWMYTGMSPTEICSVTGHSIDTMYKYYVRENLKSKFELFNNTPQEDLIKSFKETKK